MVMYAANATFHCNIDATLTIQYNTMIHDELKKD